MERMFRLLRADEIELRVGNVSKNGCTLLLYKDARCDMAILDETVGPMFWGRDHKEIKGVMYCGVSIYDDGQCQWVTKWDAGTESFTESQKGEASDSFKRSCVNWGLGRELYTSPMIFHTCGTSEYTDKNGKKKYNLTNTWEVNGMRVTKIGYKNDAISHLQIMDKSNTVVYEVGSQGKPEEVDIIDTAMAKTIIELADQKKVSVAKICEAYNVESIYSLTHEQAGKAKAKLMKTKVPE
jgi:hypothetical protein